MFDELNKYKAKGHFFFNATDNLGAVCNAPNNCSGIYCIYALEKGKINLIYMGISGRKGSDGNIIHRKGGIRGRFLTGKQFGDRRSKTWPTKMKEQNIDALDIYWWITCDEKTNDFPRDIEEQLLKKYHAVFGELPRWNNKF